MKFHDKMTATVAVFALVVSAYTACRQFVVVEEVQQLIISNNVREASDYKRPVHSPNAYYPPNENVRILVANYGTRAIILESAKVYVADWPPEKQGPGNKVCDYDESQAPSARPSFAYQVNIVSESKQKGSALVKREDAQVYEIEYNIQHLLVSDAESRKFVPNWTDGGEIDNYHYVCLETLYRDAGLRPIIVRQLFYSARLFSRSQDGKVDTFEFQDERGESPFKTVTSRWNFW